MTIDDFIDELKHDIGRYGQLVHLERIPARTAAYGELRKPLPPELEQALERGGITRLYAHQADAINAIREGKHVVVVTGTASGKTLCYNIPALEAVLENSKNRAIYIFPTKALAQDQLGKLRAFELSQPVKAATYDGDTPIAERRAIKEAAQIVLTNPDMLHIGILPYHTTWAKFFTNLKYIVVDEIHSYRGVFGSHVANVLRRLRRICAYYGSEPRFICASATIANPKELTLNLTGLDFEVVARDTSPAGEKLFIFWNPPILAATGERRSPSTEATSIFKALIRRGIRTIVFTQTRKQAELILAYTRHALGAPAHSNGSRDEELNASQPASPQVNVKDRDLADRIMAYRAGYRPEERRQIERKLFSGELLGVTSTTALEVGIDIGDLDAAILTGYPGTIASTWQQAGRAGRARSKSLAVLIAMDNPLDQYLMRRPDYFFSETPERAIVDPRNPYILAQHVLCAAYEIPITNDEITLFGQDLYGVVVALSEAGEVDYRNGRWRCRSGDYPAGRVSIRATSSESFDIIDITAGHELLGTVDASTAFLIIHPGAVYLHGGETYVVERLDVEDRKAYVNRADVSYYTMPMSQSEVRVEEQISERPFCAGTVCFGNASVTERVTGYRRHRLFSEAVIASFDLDLPPQEFHTESVWFVLPKKVTDRLIGRGYDLPGSIHAIEHAAIGLLPLFAMCDRRDIGGVSNPMHPDLDGLAGIFIYDAYPGGVGISKTAYDRAEELFEATLEAIDRCSCEEGCPSCIQSPKCGNNNQPLDKEGAVFLLRKMLEDVRAEEVGRNPSQA